MREAGSVKEDVSQQQRVNGTKQIDVGEPSDGNASDFFLRI